MMMINATSSFLAASPTPATVTEGEGGKQCCSQAAPEQTLAAHLCSAHPQSFCGARIVGAIAA